MAIENASLLKSFFSIKAFFSKEGHVEFGEGTHLLQAIYSHNIQLWV